MCVSLFNLGWYMALILEVTCEIFYPLCHAEGEMLFFAKAQLMVWGRRPQTPSLAPAPPSPGVRRSSAEIIAFAGCWLNLAHPSRNCFLWVFMKNGWDLGIMELYPNKAKHLLKYESGRRKGRGENGKNDRMLMSGGEPAYFQPKSW